MAQGRRSPHRHYGTAATEQRPSQAGTAGRAASLREAFRCGGWVRVVAHARLSDVQHVGKRRQVLMHRLGSCVTAQRGRMPRVAMPRVCRASVVKLRYPWGQGSIVE